MTGRLHVAAAAGGAEAVAMGETRMQSVHLMQPQERNFYGKIFGGFLMREGYELAYAAACAFSAETGGDERGGFPTLVAVDEVTFARPVNIGDVVSLVAMVVYTGANEALVGPPDSPETGLYQVRVDIGIMNLRTGKRSVSNEFHFTFLSRAPPAAALALAMAGDKASTWPLRVVRVPPVLPRTYQEGMEWLSGRRRMLGAMLAAATLGSFAALPACVPFDV